MTVLDLALRRLAQGMPVEEVARRAGLPADVILATAQALRDREVRLWNGRP